MEKHGYGWFLDKIDWANLVIRPEFSGSFRVQNVSLLTAFKRHYRSLRTSFDDYVFITSQHAQLTRWKHSHDHIIFIGQVLRAVCIRAFHRDVFQVLEPHFIRQNHRSALEGKIGLSLDSLQQVLQPTSSIRVIYGKRWKIQTFLTLFQWLWGSDDTYQRGPWKNLPYRLLHSLSSSIITSVLGSEHSRMWERQFKDHIRINCWLMPYPSGTSLISHGRDAAGRVEFKWWSNYTRIRVLASHAIQSRPLIYYLSFTPLCSAYITWQFSF
jgi:hypothetical protein